MAGVGGGVKWTQPKSGPVQEVGEGDVQDSDGHGSLEGFCIFG
jgi:hypothetical protein